VLLIDPRAGSGPLLHLFQALHVPTELTKLAFADFAFLGVGEGEVPVPVGIERKTIQDFLASMYNGRLPGHQLPGMLACYQDIYLVIEGLWRVDVKTNRVLVPQGKKKGKVVWGDLETGKAYGVTYGELEGMFITLEERGGVRLRLTGHQHATARFVACLYRWWTQKPWSHHRSHLRFHSATADEALLTKPTLCRVMAAQLPGVGMQRSGAVAEHFGSVAAMAQASEEEWLQIEGIGSVLAKRIVEAIQIAGWTG
jgi:ERCC4-type nuclease